MPSITCHADSVKTHAAPSAVNPICPDATDEPAGPELWVWCRDHARMLRMLGHDAAVLAANELERLSVTLRRTHAVTSAQHFDRLGEFDRDYPADWLLSPV